MTFDEWFTQRYPGAGQAMRLVSEEAWYAGKRSRPEGGRLDAFKAAYVDGNLSDKPASPLPWRLKDATIWDAKGDCITGYDERGQPVEFLEFDADYIWQAVTFYSEWLDSPLPQQEQPCGYCNQIGRHIKNCPATWKTIVSDSDAARNEDQK